MATNRPDPGEFLEMAQRFLRDLIGDLRNDDDDEPHRTDSRRGDEPWAEATRRARESFTREAPRPHREPSPEEQRENLTFALATRAVEALEDLALNVAAIRQRLERTGKQAPTDPA